jgi:hypothetical protein
MHVHLATITSGSPLFCGGVMAALWQVTLSCAQPVLPRSAPDLAELSETAQPEKSAHGLAGVETLTARFRLPLHASLMGCSRGI